jgi:hypothetical protein
MTARVTDALRECCVTGEVILEGMCGMLPMMCRHLYVCIGLTDEDLAEMGIAPRPLRRSVLVAFAKLVKSKGMCGGVVVYCV